MTVLREGNLQITFPPDSNPRKFDDENHRLSHCMKAVDFILELSDRFIFIEFKDPQHPRSNIPHSETPDYLTSTIDNSLVPKYRDTFLYEYASGRANKDIYYYVLIAIDNVDSALLIRQTEHLKQRIPMHGPQSRPWQQPFIKSCAVFNIESWNRNLSQFPIKRIL